MEGKNNQIAWLRTESGDAEYMNPEIYFHILEIGVIYEKGGKKGTKWLLGEKKRLLDECELWRHLIQYAAEEAGLDCSEKVFSDLRKICKKHGLPCYERVLSLRTELLASTCRHIVPEDDKKLVIAYMTEAIDEIERNLSNREGKSKAYEVMYRLHNMPKALHGRDELGRGANISVKDALKWGQKEAME